MDPLLPTAYLAVSSAMVLLPLLAIYLLMRRREIGLKVFGIAAVAFVCSQFVIMVLNSVLELLISGWVATNSSLLTIVVIVGIIVALGEEGVRLAFLRRFKTYKKEPIAFGIGWGSVQMVLLGIIAFLFYVQVSSIAEMGVEGYISTINNTSIYSEAELLQLRTELQFIEGLPWYSSIADLLQPLVYVLLQISFTMIVLHYLKTNRPNYFGFAFLAHAVVATMSHPIIYLFMGYYVAMAIYTIVSVVVFLAALRISGLDIAKFQKKYL